MDVDVAEVLEADFPVSLFECTGCVVWDTLFFVVVEYSDIVCQAGSIAQKHPVDRLDRFNYRSYQHIRSDLYAGSRELSVLVSRV